LFERKIDKIPVITSKVKDIEKYELLSATFILIGLKNIQICSIVFLVFLLEYLEFNSKV
jgi:hypothetical protein